MEFRFNGILDQDTSQEEVFERVAQPVVMNCLDGYNGTIFAYGQTGSGKTFTMSGAEHWNLRGITPRILTNIFDEVSRRKDIQFNIYVSFMEIYNEHAYDLLDRQHMELSMEKWTKVTMMEDDYGNVHMKNLSVHHVRTEQDAIDLLMMGNFVRHVSATPLNQASSRSHSIFTITIEARPIASETFFNSKLHLVDLAGSERVSKSQVEGNLLNEAKHINLSLSYLEQVIVALHEKKLGNRQHIPYRNSLMTTVLKDSLGGNCKTVMIATMASETEHLEETISTARFAQRCSQLVNEIKKNEKIDMDHYVKRLEFEKQQLQQELAYYKLHFGTKEAREEAERFLKSGRMIISENAQKKINSDVSNYLNDQTERLEVSTMEEAQSVFAALKEFYNSRLKEYINELKRISSKLLQYEEVKSKKRQSNESSTESSHAIPSRNTNKGFTFASSQANMQQTSSQVFYPNDDANNRQVPQSPQYQQRQQLTEEASSNNDDFYKSLGFTGEHIKKPEKSKLRSDGDPNSTGKEQRRHQVTQPMNMYEHSSINQDLFADSVSSTEKSERISKDSSERSSTDPAVQQIIPNTTPVKQRELSPLLKSPRRVDPRIQQYFGGRLANYAKEPSKK